MRQLTSTTLSDPQLLNPLFGLVHPPHVLRAADHQQPCENLLYERPNLRKREPQSLSRPHPFGLKKGVGNGADHHVMLPTGVRPSFEVIETELGFEVLVVLFDRPAVMGEPHQLRQRSRRRQRHEVMLAPTGRAEAAFAEQPDFWSETSMPPVGGRRHALR